LASLTLDQAKHVVTLINHLILAPTLVIIPLYALQLSPTRNYWRFLLCLLYPLLSYPLIVSVRYGQINIVLLAALVGFWIASLRKRHLVAGLWLSIAIICKTLPLLFIPMLLVIGRWKICAFTLIFLSVACLISYSILPSDMWRDWLFNVVPSGAYMSEPYGLFFPSASWNQSLNGIIARASTRSLWSDPLLYRSRDRNRGHRDTTLSRAKRSPRHQLSHSGHTSNDISCGAIFMGASHRLSPTHYPLHTLPERFEPLEVASSHSLRRGYRRGHIYLSRTFILPIRWSPAAMAVRARVYLAM
jgi:hypothetical protein